MVPESAGSDVISRADAGAAFCEYADELASSANAAATTSLCMRCSALGSDCPEGKRVATTPVPAALNRNVCRYVFRRVCASRTWNSSICLLTCCASRTRKPISRTEDAELWPRCGVCKVVAYYL